MNTPRFWTQSLTAYEQTSGTGAQSWVDFLGSFNYEKNESLGEDANPIVLSLNGSVWLGVFDGMGGAGAQLIETPEGTFTAAYLASRTAASLTEAWIHSTASQLPIGNRAVSMHDFLSTGINERQRQFKEAPSRVKSRLIRKLPTTAAIACVSPLHGGGFRCSALWAGDSRVFVLSSKGLVQLTADHLKEPLDALANLSQDSPLSNCLEADASFFVEEVAVDFTGPVVVLAATDGCFGYVDSPMRFEELIVESLFQAKSFDSWRECLLDRVKDITGDDASLAFVSAGAGSFVALKKYMQNRRRSLRRTYVGRLDAVQDAIATTRSQVEELHMVEKRQLEYSNALWESYKRNYHLPLNTWKSG